MAEFKINTSQVEGLIRSACVLAGATPEQAESACRAWFTENVPPLSVEYRPGHLDARMPGGAFVQSGVISPSFIQQYLKEGGEAVCRMVGPFSQVSLPLSPPRQQSQIPSEERLDLLQQLEFEDWVEIDGNVMQPADAIGELITEVRRMRAELTRTRTHSC